MISELELAWVDPADDAAYAGWFAVLDAAARHGREDPLVWEREDLRGHLLGDDDAEHLLAAAHRDGGVVGVGWLELPQRENLDGAEVDVEVLPTHRRSGVGSALFTMLEGEATSRGRSRLEAEAVVVGDGPPAASPGVAFAARHGFRVAHTEDHLVLDVAPGSVRPRPVATPYDVVRWRDRAPDTHAAAYAGMRAALSADVPRGELTREPEVWDVDRLRAAEERSRLQGRTTLVAAAVGSDGSVVGHTTLTVPHGEGAAVYQGDTYVMTAHRGHGLGRVLKEHNLAALAALRGEVATAVHTWTADVNASMTAINRALGFRVVEVTCQLERSG